MTQARLRVLIVLTPPLDPTTGGVQMSTVKMSRMLASHGHRVGVFSYAHDGHVVPDGVEMFCPSAYGGLANEYSHAALERSVRDFQPDVVINQMPYEHEIADVVRASCSAMLVGCLRNTLFSVVNNIDAYAESVLPSPMVPLARNGIGRRFLTSVHRRRHARDLERILATNDRFVMFAEPNLQELAYFVPDYDPDRIALIPNSIEGVVPSLPRKERRILWLGRVEARQKRADLILPMWRKLAPRLPDWTFDIVGDGPLLDQLRSTITGERLPRIEVHGRQPSKPFFERASVFVMTSAFEGFPNTLVEAQSQGAVPVVFDSYPMARWLIRDGHDGVVIPTGDVDALVDAVARLCDEDSERRAIAEGALASVEKFTETDVAVAWNELLQDVTGRRTWT